MLPKSFPDGRSRRRLAASAIVAALVHLQLLVDRRGTGRALERGQSTAEYALVLVAVASMVGVVIAYVSGDGGGMITGLFGAAFAKMRSLVGG